MRTFALAVGALLAPQVAAQCQPWQHDAKVRLVARLRLRAYGAQCVY